MSHQSMGCKLKVLKVKNEGLAQANRLLKNKVRRLESEKQLLEKQLREIRDQQKPLIQVIRSVLDGTKPITAILSGLESDLKVLSSIDNQTQDLGRRPYQMTDQQKDYHRRASLNFVRETFKERYDLSTIRESDSSYAL